MFEKSAVSEQLKAEIYRLEQKLKDKDQRIEQLEKELEYVQFKNQLLRGDINFLSGNDFLNAD